MDTLSPFDTHSQIVRNMSKVLASGIDSILGKRLKEVAGENFNLIEDQKKHFPQVKRVYFAIDGSTKFLFDPRKEGVEPIVLLSIDSPKIVMEGNTFRATQEVKTN